MIGGENAKTAAENAKTPMQNPWWKAVVGLADVLGGDLLDSPSLRAVRKVFRSADVVRQLRTDLAARKHAVGGGIHEEVTRRGLEVWGSTSQLDSLCLEYAAHAPTSKVEFTDPTGDGLLVRVDLGGTDIYLHITEHHGRRYARNLFVAPDRRQDAKRGVANLIWRAERTQSLLVQSRETWGEAFVSFLPIGEPGDYAAGNDGRSGVLAEVAARTAAFRAAKVGRRVLLHGPPGTGKTTIARALSARIHGRLLQVPVKTVARFGASVLGQVLSVLQPDVVLLDDMDRDAEASVDLLDLLVAAETPVVVGTVNTLATLDPALLRPGRFDETIEVKEPDPDYLHTIIAFYLDKFGLNGARGYDPAMLVTDMAGFAPADVREVLLAASVVGHEVYATELARVRRQRTLHSGEAVGRWMDNQRQPRAPRGLPIPPRR